MEIISLGEMLVEMIYESDNSFRAYAGGAPANVAIDCSRLGHESAFIGKRGDDFFGRFLQKTLEENNVNVDGFVEDRAYSTAIALVVRANNEPSFQFYGNPSAHDMLSEDEINEKLFENAKWFHFGSISLYSDKSRHATIRAIELAKKNNMIVSYDPNLREHLLKEKPNALSEARAILAMCDIVKVSENELLKISGASDEKSAVNELFQKGPKIIAVTRGERGASFYTKKYRINESAQKVNVIDTTGAGDAFTAGLICSVIEKHDPKNFSNIDEATARDVLRFAVSVSSKSVEFKGATTGVLKRNI